MLSINELTGWLNSPAADDDQVISLETRAVAWFESQTLRYFGAPADTTVYLFGSGKRSLWLPEQPIGTPTVNERCLPGDTPTAIVAADASGFLVRTDGELVRKGGYVWRRNYEYEVTLSRGYASTGSGGDAKLSTPEDVRAAIFAIVEAWYSEWKRGSVGLKSESVGVRQYEYTVAGEDGGVNVALIPTVRDAINFYRDPTIPYTPSPHAETLTNAAGPYCY